jgi:hypothetical protein
MNPNHEQALPVHSPYVVVVRRRMTRTQHDRLRRAARKMVQDVRKYVKRKGL